MLILIDGYNLLFLSGLMPERLAPGGLERARLALVNSLAASLEPSEAAQTVVVFDAAHPPPGLPRQFVHRGITVRFAEEGKEADEAIEELIRREPAPKKLVVVSSDHRVQRAARRRGAEAVDSDAWYDELLAARHRRLHPADEPTPSPPLPSQAPVDVDFWLQYFGGEAAMAEWERAAAEAAAEQPAETAGELAEESTAVSDEEPLDLDKPRPGESAELDNPFPEGYAEDLLENDREPP